MLGLPPPPSAVPAVCDRSVCLSSRELKPPRRPRFAAAAAALPSPPTPSVVGVIQRGMVRSGRLARIQVSRLSTRFAVRSYGASGPLKLRSLGAPEATEPRGP